MSATAFALAHVPLLVFDQRQTLPAVLPALGQKFVLALVFGWLFARTRTLAAPITAHATWDTAVALLG